MGNDIFTVLVTSEAHHIAVVTSGTLSIKMTWQRRSVPARLKQLSVHWQVESIIMRGDFGKSSFPWMLKVGQSSVSAPGTRPTIRNRLTCALLGSEWSVDVFFLQWLINCMCLVGTCMLRRRPIGTYTCCWQFGACHQNIAILRINLYSVNRSRPATAARLKELEARGMSFEPLTRSLSYLIEDEEEYLKAVKKHPREPFNWRGKGIFNSKTNPLMLGVSQWCWVTSADHTDLTIEVDLISGVQRYTW